MRTGFWSPSAQANATRARVRRHTGFAARKQPRCDAAAKVRTSRRGERSPHCCARSRTSNERGPMNIALLLIIVIAVVLAIVGGLNTALNWLLWVALIVGVIALIAFLFRVISGSRS